MYQIKHTTLGIFQGATMTGLMWFKTSGRPELGYMGFPSQETADQYVQQTILAKPLDDSDRLLKKDITVEAFNEEENARLLDAPGAKKRKAARLADMALAIKTFRCPACFTVEADEEATGYIARYSKLEGIGMTPDEAFEDLLKILTKGK